MTILKSRISAITAASFAAVAAFTTLAATSTAAQAKNGIQPKPAVHECFWRPGAKTYLGGDDKFSDVRSVDAPQPQNLLDHAGRMFAKMGVGIDQTLKDIRGEKYIPVDLDSVTTASKIKSGYCLSAEQTEILVGYTRELSPQHLQYLRNKVMIDINAGALPGGLPMVLTDHGNRRVVVPKMGMTAMDRWAFIGGAKLNAADFTKVFLPKLPNKEDALWLGNTILRDGACPAYPEAPSRTLAPLNKWSASGVVSCPGQTRIAAGP